jgi:hypothetical protein
VPQRFEGSWWEGLSDLYELVEEELLLAIRWRPPSEGDVLAPNGRSDDVADDDERETRSRAREEFILGPLRRGAGIRFQ